jgi:hypothetical protein
MSEQRRSETVVATFHSEAYKPLADITLPRLKEYCRRHKYDLQVEEYRGPLEVIGWERFARVYDLLFTYDRVMWCDADVLITNPSTKLENFSGAITMSADLNGANTGIFIARKIDLVQQLFFVINGQYGHEHFGNHQWGEQAALIHLAAMPPYRDLVTWVAQEKLNAYLHSAYGWPDFVQGKWEMGMFALQFAGMKLSSRIELAREYSEKTESFFQ